MSSYGNYGLNKNRNTTPTSDANAVAQAEEREQQKKAKDKAKTEGEISTWTAVGIGVATAATSIFGTPALGAVVGTGLTAAAAGVTAARGVDSEGQAQAATQGAIQTVQETDGYLDQRSKDAANKAAEARATEKSDLERKILEEELAQLRASRSPKAESTNS